MSRIEEKIDNNLRKGPAGFGMLVAMFVLVFLVGAGAGIFGGIFWGKKIANKNNAKSETANSGEVKGETNTNKSKTPVTDGSSVQEYTVKAGETLFTIGLKFNLPWTKIAEYNGLSEDSVIKQGQVLKIPA
ncbi:MAG TPA: LysM domain-containing protein, partial [Patescibacteria group bacterium]|nr:LysM domain-containing protein [Patescibacteria group bacterium]